MAATPLSGIHQIDSLLYGTQWGNYNGNAVHVTYSFPNQYSEWTSGYYPYNEPDYVSYLDFSQQQGIREALAAWSDFANITFTEVIEPDSEGNIRFAFANNAHDSGAWAFYPPTEREAEFSEQIWFNSIYRPANDNFTLGTRGFFTAIHEIGHAFGLIHPHEGNEILGNNDSLYYTAMSYTFPNIYDKLVDGSYGYLYPSTPMLYDIQAIQFLYGANWFCSAI